MRIATLTMTTMAMMMITGDGGRGGGGGGEGGGGRRKVKLIKRTIDSWPCRRTLYTWRLQGEQQDNDTGHTTGSIPMTQQDQLRERAGTTSPENVCRK